MGTSFEEALLWALQNTVSPDANTRKEAERIIVEGSKQPGYTRVLFQVMVSDTAAPEVKQSASIQLKQKISRNWDPVSSYASQEEQQNYFRIPEDEREFIKENAIEALIKEIGNSVIKKTLCAAIRSIAESDYPTHWPNLLDKIIHYLALKEEKYVYPALLVLQLLCKSFHFKTDSKRIALYRIIEVTFPILIQLSEALKSYDALISAEMQTLIGKIFCSAIQFTIPQYLLVPENFFPWMNYFGHVLSASYPLPPANLPEDKRARWPWWTAKKRAAKIFNKLFHKYGSIKRVKDDLKQFAHHFLNTYACAILQTFMALLKAHSQGFHLPDRLLHIALEYVDNGIRIASTFRIIKPEVQQLITQVVFPLLCFNDEDAITWRDDPIEYLRREFDFLDDFFSSRKMAQNLLYDLVKLRGQTHLDNFMYWLVALLQKYNEAPPDQKNYREKDGALTAVGHLAPRLRAVEAYERNLEPLIATHVLPEFDSPHGFLRAKACWIFSIFYNVEYKDPNIFFTGLQKILNLFKDSELPVRVRAACSIRHLISNNLAPEKLYNLLPQIFDAYFSLMKEVDNDELVSNLEAIISVYGERIEPYAIALCQKLSDEFIRLAAEEEEDDNESASLAATECLGAIQSILQSVKKIPRLFPQLEQVLFPLLHKSINQDYLMYFEDIVCILSYLTYYSPAISPQMWELFPLLYNAFDEWACDFMGTILVPMDNFISRATEQFLAPGTPYLQMVFNMFKKLVGDPNSEDVDAGEACKLMEVVFHNCRGRVDNVIPSVLQIAGSRLVHPNVSSINFKVLLLEVWANSLYYNPQLTLQVLEATNSTQTVFTMWFNFLEKLKRIHDKKIVVLGLSSILQLNFGTLPQLVQGNLKSIIQIIINLLSKIEAQKKEQDEEEDEEDDDDEEEGDVPENEDVGNFDQDLTLLAEAVGKYSYNDDDDELLEEEEDYISPIDAVDEMIFFIENFQEFSRREQEAYSKFAQSCTPEEFATLNSLNQLAESRKQALLQQQQQQQQQQH